MLALAELRGIMKNPSLPSGIVLVKGNADYTNVNGQPPLQSTTLAGTIQSQILQVRTPSLNTDIRDIGANYAFSNGNADLQNLTARLLGGQLKANATIRDVSGKQQGHVVAALRGISLADLKRVANSAGLKPVLISGYVNANSDATWVGNINNVQVKADAIADGKLGSTQNSANGTMPMKAEVHARYNGQTREVALNKSYVRMPHTSLDANGTVSTHSALEVNLLSNDLHELETVADIFSQPGAQPLNLSGQATFNGTVRGSTSAPQIAGQLNAKNVQVRGSSFRLLRTSVSAGPSQASLQNGDLELATNQGHITFNLQTGLHNWTHTPNSPFMVSLNASQVSVAELTRAANVTTPVTGTLNANIAAQGTQLNPIGQGEITPQCQRLRRAHQDRARKVQWHGRRGPREPAGAGQRRRCQRRANLLSQAGRLRRDPGSHEHPARQDPIAARSEPRCRRRSEPEGQRPRYRERPARHRISHHSRPRDPEAADSQRQLPGQCRQS